MTVSVTKLFGSLLGGRKAVVAETAPEPAPPARDSERIPSFKDATVTTMSGEKWRAIAVDIDDHGARVRFMTQPAIGDKVRVSISGVCTLRLAKVMWRDRNDVGLRYVMDTPPAGNA